MLRLVRSDVETLNYIPDGTLEDNKVAVVVLIQELPERISLRVLENLGSYLFIFWLEYYPEVLRIIILNGQVGITVISIILNMTVNAIVDF